jgi:peptide-methionine (R)-S-oxide reductase
MISYIQIFLFLLFACVKPSPETCQNETASSGPIINFQKNPHYSRTDTSALKVSNAEWKKILPADLYGVAREKDTERPFTGRFWDSDDKGTYYCAVCGNRLFLSDTKFSSHCGWPSFFQSVRKNAVKYLEDRSHGMVRTEVICGRCESHLGHIFDDGPPPTGKRFCMNSISLDFEAFGKRK